MNKHEDAKIKKTQKSLHGKPPISNLHNYYGRFYSKIEE